MDEGSFKSATKSVRRKILTAITKSGKGHIGGALSCTDVLYYLFSEQIVQISQPGENTARPLVMSKGHSTTALLAVVDELRNTNSLEPYNSKGSLLGNNPSELVEGVEFHTGSLGHGPGLGAGVALAKRLSGDDNAVCILLSDGELNEGSVWEAFQFISKHQLNISILIDNNNQICEDFLEDVSPKMDFKSIFEGLGYEFCELDGHSLADLQKLKPWIYERQAPRICCLKTVKGKGVSFMEGVIKWHHSIPDDAMFNQAMEELK
ncbi:MAG: hypothetical protein HN731_07420 [Rhodospirillaceae bacterium]|nr:hypothetical protein [Rhodospirillaceae bacterium]